MLAPRGMPVVALPTPKLPTRPLISLTYPGSLVVRPLLKSPNSGYSAKTTGRRTALPRGGGAFGGLERRLVARRVGAGPVRIDAERREIDGRLQTVRDVIPEVLVLYRRKCCTPANEDPDSQNQAHEEPQKPAASGARRYGFDG